MTKILSAKAVARTDGCVTLASAVFEGPVLKKRKKTATNISTHAEGNGVKSIATENGKAIMTPIPEIRKYEPGKRFRRQSPKIPPESVAVKPAKTVMPPKIMRLAGGKPRYSKYPGTQKDIPPI